MGHHVAGQDETVRSVEAVDPTDLGANRRFTLTVHRFRVIAMITTIGICLLVVAGGAVRLTGSGLGCDDWPGCNDERFIDVSSGHAAIEQINRIFSGLIGLPTLAMAVGAFRVRPNRTGLAIPSVAVLLTVLANGAIGGVAVRQELHPALVQSHFILAMISIAFGIVAVLRATAIAGGDTKQPAAETVGGVPAALIALSTAVALVTGTVVTGTGPHAGDEDARRFGFDISSVARIHSVTVLVALGAALWLAASLRRRRLTQSSVGVTLSAWMFVGFLQAIVGYVQYFNGVPELLVGVHIALATCLWVVTVAMTCHAYPTRSGIA